MTYPLARRSAQRAALAILAAALTLATAVAGGIFARSASASTLPIALGVTVSGDVDQSLVDTYTGLAGRAPQTVMWYQSWAEPLYWSSQRTSIDALNVTPLITWDPLNANGGIPLADITAGVYDSYLRSSASLAKQWNRPLEIRLAHEMNLTDSGFGPNVASPSAFVAAWKHVVDVFRAQGVTNVSWVWSPNVDCNGGCPFDAYFPGDDYVDVVALDGYNYSSTSGQPWLSFDQVFRNSYDDITALSTKPVMIAETSSAEAGGDKAAWIRQAFLTDIPAHYPRISSVIWFDRIKETDWRVNSSDSSLAAWRDVVASSLYGGTVVPTASPSPSATPDSPSPSPTATATASPTTSPTVSPSPTPTQPSKGKGGRKIRIAAARYNPQGRDASRLNGEFVKVVNRGDSTVSLRGWALTSRHSHITRRLAGVHLRPGASVRVHTGRGHRTAHDVYLGRHRPMWRNAGDGAVIRTPHRDAAQTCSWKRAQPGFIRC